MPGRSEHLLLCTANAGCCADLNNCYFADPAVDVLGNLATDNVTGLAEFDSEQHRKIRLYLELASGNDANGHGTHTMGTLCGSSPSSAGTYASDYRCVQSCCLHGAEMEISWSSAISGTMCWKAAGGCSGLSGLACAACLQRTRGSENASPPPQECEASASCQCHICTDVHCLIVVDTPLSPTRTQVALTCACTF